jgi:hypothetical protein
MRIAYASTDEVNQALATQLAEACGAVVQELLPKEPPPDGQFDAVLYDLDAVPRPERKAVLARLLSGPAHGRKAVHGYALSDEVASILCRHGIAASRQLGPGLFQALCQAADPQRAGTPSDAIQGRRCTAPPGRPLQADESDQSTLA